VPLLPPAERTRLKGQSFVRPERIKEVLESVQSVLMQRVPDLKAVMKVRPQLLLKFVLISGSRPELRLVPTQFSVDKSTGDW
jgi:hypothetical protein